MISLFCRRCGAVLCLLLSFSGRDLSAQPENPGSEFRTAVQERRDAVPRFRCTVQSARVTERSVFGDRQPSAAAGARDSNEPLLIESTLIYTVDIERGWFRLEDRGEIYSEVTHSLVPRFAITLFDGEKGFALKPEESTDGKDVDLAELTPDTPIIARFASKPLFWTFGIINSPDLIARAPTNLTGADCRWEQDGPHLILTRRLTTHEYRYVVDPAFGHNVVRCEIRRQEGSSMRLVTTHDMTYSKTDQGWLPQSWETVFPGKSTQRFTVTNWEFPVEFQAADFAPPPDYLQPGMLVSRPGDRLKRVAADGSLVSPRSGETLTRTLPGGTVTGIAVLCLALVALWWWRFSSLSYVRRSR